MAHGRCGRALGRLLGASGGVFGGLGEVFGVMLAPKMAAKSGKYQKSMAPRGRRFQSGFLMVFVSKISSRGDINSFKYTGKIVVFKLSAVLA